MKKGILLIALGHSNYFRMAVALAATIKANNEEILISVVTDGCTYFKEDAEKLLFDQVITAPAESYTNTRTGSKTEFIRAKTYTYDLSPYDETIFFDVDIAILPGRDLNTVFEAMKDHAFVMSTYGGVYDTAKEKAVSFWVDTEEVLKAYGLNGKRWFDYHSEFMYFKKGKEIKKYFDAVKKVFANPNPKIDYIKFAGAATSDEIAFTIASMQQDFYSGLDKYVPVFWYRRETGKDKSLRTYEISSDFVGYSLAGGSHPKNVVSNYQVIVGAAFYKLKLKYPYQYKNKRMYLPERKLG